jgi:hypothetical protein
MTDNPREDKHRRRLATLIAFGGRHGLLSALTLAALTSALSWQFILSWPLLIAAPVAGALSVQQSWHFHRDGAPSHWLAAVLFAFAGWPVVQLIERNGITQWEQGMLTLQYFSLMAATWLLLAWLKAKTP